MIQKQLAEDFWRGRTWRGKRLGWNDMTLEEQERSLRHAAAIVKYDEDQPRDENGQWTDGGGGGGGGADKPSGAPAAAPTESSPQESAPSGKPAKGSSGTVHSGGYVDPSVFEEGKSGKTKFENINYDAHKHIAGYSQGMSAGMLKDQVVKGLTSELSKDSRWTKAFDQQSSYHRADQILRSWASTSGDHEALSVAMQLATRDEFELSGSVTKHMVKNFVGGEKGIWQQAAQELGLSKMSLSATKDAMRAFSRAEYNKTQQWLEDRGIKEVAVYRGMGRALGRQNYVGGATTLQPMSSFSTSLSTAKGFVSGGLPKYKQNVLASVVPAKSIISTCRSGRGCWSESEVVVLGNKMGFVGFQRDSKWPPPKDKIKWPKGKAFAVLKAEDDEVVDLNDLDIDADLDHADWTKTAWDLPPYKSPEFMDLPVAADLDHFRTLPVYRHAVDSGLIVDDEWVGPNDASKSGVDSSAELLRVVQATLGRLGMGGLGVEIAEGSVGLADCACFKAAKGGSGRFVFSAHKLVGRSRGEVDSVVKHEVSHARMHFANHKSPEVLRYIRDNADVLRDEGAMPYSSAYWDQAHTPPRKSVDPAGIPPYLRLAHSREPFYRAVDESLAEMHESGEITPAYQKLDDIIDSVWKEYNEDDHPRDEDGQWTDGGGGGRGRDKPAAGKPGRAASSKVRNALATYKPSTKAKQDRATAAEQRIVKMIGGKGTDDNAPMDVIVSLGRKTIGVEVKSVQDNGNNKITMHPASLQRKKEWESAGRGRSVHTVVVDTRHNKLYHRAGVGSFRLHTLTQVKDAKHLRSLLGI